MRILSVLGAMGLVVSCLVACRSEKEKVAKEVTGTEVVEGKPLTIQNYHVKDMTLPEAIAALNRQILIEHPHQSQQALVAYVEDPRDSSAYPELDALLGAASGEAERKITLDIAHPMEIEAVVKALTDISMTHHRNWNGALVIYGWHLGDIQSVSSEEARSGNTAQGRVVMDKLSAVVLPQVNFQDITVEEAIAFLSNRLMEIELEDEPELRGISMIVSLPPEQTAGASEAAPVAPQPTINLVQKDIKWLDAFAEVLRQGHVDGYLTSVGFVITAEGQAPFPNSKAEHGEIWHVLRKTR